MATILMMFRMIIVIMNCRHHHGGSHVQQPPLSAELCWSQSLFATCLNSASPPLSTWWWWRLWWGWGRGGVQAKARLTLKDENWAQAIIMSLFLRAPIYWRCSFEILIYVCRDGGRLWWSTIDGEVGNVLDKCEQEIMTMMMTMTISNDDDNDDDVEGKVSQGSGARQ